MKIATDFSQRVVVRSETTPWIPSPMPGVDRRPLDRVGGEVARATSIVRYAPGSEFSSHVHAGGEEFIVLDGVFQDEHGDFPAGSYIRNPPQSKHQPSSENGCVIFVKLWQFQPQDRTHLRLQTKHMPRVGHEQHEGVTITSLYKDNFEEVNLIYLEPNADFVMDAHGGAELLILEGSIVEHADILEKYSWLRTPINSRINAKAGKLGATLWAKEGHLTDVENQISRVVNTVT